MMNLFLEKSLNSRGTNGFEQHFPFAAKMETVITASCDDFCERFLTRNQDHKLQCYQKYVYFLYPSSLLPIRA